jgi:hypothetical protein
MEIAMNRQLLCALGTASLAVFAAGAAYAGTKANEEQMMDACIHQYIADNLANYQGKVTVNKLASGYQPLLLGVKTQIMVTAVHRTSGAKLGTVVCDASADGAVSVAHPDAVAAAKLAKIVKTPEIARNSAE